MLNWLLLILWSGLIFFLSSMPVLGPKWSGFFKEALPSVFHFSEYAILAFLTVRAFNSFSKLSEKQVLIISIIFAIIYAISDEYHQSFVPGREASMGDILVDGLGIIAVASWHGFRNNRALK